MYERMKAFVAEVVLTLHLCCIVAIFRYFHRFTLYLSSTKRMEIKLIA